MVPIALYKQGKSASLFEYDDRVYPLGITRFSRVYNDRRVGLDEHDKDFVDSRVETIQVVERRQNIYYKGRDTFTAWNSETVDFSNGR